MVAVKPTAISLPAIQVVIGILPNATLSSKKYFLSLQSLNPQIYELFRRCQKNNRHNV